MAALPETPVIADPDTAAGGLDLRELILRKALARARRDAPPVMTTADPASVAADYEALRKLQDTPLDVSGLEQVGKNQQAASTRDFGAAMALGALGGRAFKTPSEALLRSAIARSAPLRANLSDVGYFDPETGKFVENPVLAKASQEKRLAARYDAAADAMERQQKLLENSNRVEDAAALGIQAAKNREAADAERRKEQARHNKAMEAARNRRTDVMAFSKESATTAKTRADFRQAYTGLDSFETLTKDLGRFEAFTPDKLAEVGSAYSNLLIKLKDLATLGALSGPDLGLVQDMISDPASMWGFIYGKSGRQKQIEQVRGAIERAEKAYREQFGETAVPVIPKQGTPAKQPMTIDDVRKLYRE